MPDTIITTVVAALIVSGITALTAVACKQPAGFKKIFYALQPMLGVALIGGWSWNSSTVMAAHGVVQSQCCKGVDPDVIYKAAQVYDVPTWAFVSVVAMSLYLILLSCLPSILEDKRK